jgi:hypothetical protein
MVAGHFMALAALLVQANPQAAILHVNVFNFHRERRADARERIDHQPDQGAVAQTNDGGCVDRVEKLTSFGGIEHWRLAAPHDMARPTFAVAGLVGMIWPITIQSNRWRKAARRSFAVGTDRAWPNCST